MKPSLLLKLQHLAARFEELGHELSSPTVMDSLSRFRELSKEYSDLEKIVTKFRQYQDTQQAFLLAEEMLKDNDPDMQALAYEESKELKDRLEKESQALETLLIPKDPNDSRNVYLEIRAGTGGDEAALFAGDLFRMYSRFAERQRWRIEIMTESVSEKGGFKEIILKVLGQDVYSKLKFESGVHRVQRVPATEAQGRIHTSACTVAVLPEVEEIDSIEINDGELRIDTFRASGAGGQHVNRTDSAVRITHLPSGLVVECQDERSQHKNKAKAMAVLKAKLLAQEQTKQREEQARTRKSLVGSGDRSERIRTYNFPQGRLTDHRINLTLYKLLDILDGDLLPVIEPLSREHVAEQIETLE